MKLFAAMETYIPREGNLTLDGLIELNGDLNEQTRVCHKHMDSFSDAQDALESLVKLESLGKHDVRVYNVTMESINDQLGFPEGTMLASEGVVEGVKGFATRVWAKIVAMFYAIRNFVRRLFNMTPILSEKELEDQEAEIVAMRLARIKIINDAIHKNTAAANVEIERRENDLKEREGKLHEAEVELLANRKADEATEKVREGKRKEEERLKIETRKENIRRASEDRELEVARLAARTVEEIELELEASNSAHIIANLDTYKFEASRAVMLKIALESCKLNSRWLPGGVTLNTVYKLTHTTAMTQWMENKIGKPDCDLIIFKGGVIRFKYNEMDEKWLITLGDRKGKGAGLNKIMKIGEGSSTIRKTQIWLKRGQELCSEMLENLRPEDFIDAETHMTWGKMMVGEMDFIKSEQLKVSMETNLRSKVFRELTSNISKGDTRKLMKHIFGSKM